MDLVQFALVTGVPLLAIINPVAALPAFISMTPDETPETRVAMALRASAFSGLILAVFTAFGLQIFAVFGVSLSSFRIAGGLVLLLIALDSLQAKRSSVKETDEEMREGTIKEDISITPLAVPMLAGPGAMSTVIVLKSKAANAAQVLMLYGMIALVSLITFLVFYVAVKGVKRLNPIVMNIFNRLTGLLLAASGVEFILSGLKASGTF